MKSKATLWAVAATSVVLVSTVGVAAMSVNEQGAAVLAEMVRDPLAILGQRSPGQRQPGALFQTKPSRAIPLALAPRRQAPPPVLASGLAPPFADAAADFSCERLTQPASVVASGPINPAAESLAGQLVTAVQQALAANDTSGQAQREDAVERGIERVLDNSRADPELARSALTIVQARLAALGLSCAPGVPQAMKVASAAAIQAATPSDLQPGAISQPGGPPAPIGTPPGSGGGGGGGGTTHPPAR